MKNRIRNFTFLIITLAQALSILNAQDIPGDWYGVMQTADSLHVNLHIYRNKEGLKATMDSPDQGAFGIQVDKITFKKDTLFWRIVSLDVTYTGNVKHDYSGITGELLQYKMKFPLDFGREKLKSIIPVNKNALPVIPAKVKIVKVGPPDKIPYTGIRTVECGTPELIEIDTSKLKVLTPGKGGVLYPEVYTFPEPITQDEYTRYGKPQNASIIVRAKHTKPVTAQPMRMNDAACFNIQCLDVEQDLIDQEIHSILEDTKGNLWFGSNIGGICRYDGKSLNYYTTKEGLSSDGVVAIYEDKTGNIWMGTYVGLCKYDGKSFTQYSGGLIPWTLSIMESKNGNMWFGTINGAFEKKGNILTHYTTDQGLTGNPVMSIVEDKYGNIWFGTEGGVCKYDGDSFTHFTEKEGLICNSVISIIEDKYGNLWIGTQNGVSKYDGKSFSQYTVNEGLSNNYINSIKEDQSGNLWLGTFGGGVTMYDGKTFTHFTDKEGLSNNKIFSIIEDKSRNIWVATGGSGVIKLQRNSFTYFTQAEDIDKNLVTSIMEDKNGNIWFGIYGEGLIKYDGNSFMVMTEKEGLYNIYIHSIIEDKDGNIWFDGYGSSLQKYDGNLLKLYYDYEYVGSPIAYFTNCLYEDNKGNIWFGSWGDGIKKFNGESFIYFSGVNMPPSEYIGSILQDNNGDIWFGPGPWGLFKYDGEHITKYNIDEGLSDTWITSLFEDKTGNLWIGTRTGGVNKFDGQSFTNYTEKEGLSSNRISSVIMDKKGNVWVGTKKGLSLLSPRKDGTYSITTFDKDDGLKELSFNSNSVCLDSRDHLWWGTNDIVTMLDLNTYEIIPESPVIQLNNIQINQAYIDFGALLPKNEQAEQNSVDTGTMINLRGLKFSDVAPFYNYPLDLILPHYLNHVTFDFSAINWTAPQSIRYQYMLDGLDKEWSPLITENKADYRNLPSGKYTFRVKAVSKANIWSETFEYPFVVRPPWWFRWWAYTFYAAVLVLLARYYLRYRVSRERIKAEIKIKQVEVEKVQELDRMKSRFFANISHEFRTPLTLILGPVEGVLKKKGKEAVLQGEELGIIRRNAKRLQRLIDQILDIAKLETGKVRLQVSEGNLSEYIRSIILSFLSLAESKKINYKYDIPDIQGKVYFDRDKLEKVLTNLISNAFKFTPTGGEIGVKLKCLTPDDQDVPEFIEISVRDNGIGIPADQINKIFDRFYQVSGSDTREHEGTGIGLSLARELIDIYRGVINVESEPGKGSLFKVRLPVSRGHFKSDEIVETIEDKGIGVKYQPSDIIEEISVTEEIPSKLTSIKNSERPVILIVEDNADLRKYISNNLKDEYQVLEAENGKNGLIVSTDEIPDLVISDLMMPVMGGLELCRQIRQDQRTNHIPVIMLTAKADKESKLEGLSTGADDYLIKPFDADELNVRVKNLIEQRKRLREKFRNEFLMDPASTIMPATEDEFLARLLDCTKKHLEDPEFTVKQLGEELHLSHTQLYRKVLSLTDHTPNEYIRNYRLMTAARMFLEGNTNITSVLYTVGYNSPSYFTQCFRELFGINPSDYIRQKGTGAKN